MRKLFNIVYVLGFYGVVLCSCNKDVVSGDNEGKEIILYLEPAVDIEVENQTKATAITSVAGLGTIYWAATTGSAGSETSKYGNTSATAAATVATGKYQTATPTAYNWYVSNNSLTVGSSTTISASNTKDVCCGRTALTNSASPAVTLNHIFARTGSLTLTSRSGYTDTATSWSIKSKGSNTGTAGTYNLTTGAWSSTTALAATTITGSSDKYLIPGTYTITVTFTHARGDYSTTLTRSADITLVAGKTNNINATVTDDGASQIQLGLTLTAWGSNAVSVNLPNS